MLAHVVVSMQVPWTPLAMHEDAAEGVQHTSDPEQTPVLAV